MSFSVDSGGLTGSFPYGSGGKRRPLVIEGDIIAKERAQRPTMQAGSSDAKNEPFASGSTHNSAHFERVTEAKAIDSTRLQEHRGRSYAANSYDTLARSQMPTQRLGEVIDTYA